MSEYTLCTKLLGTKGPVNVVLFSKDGNFLLSGGDDECVRVWNTTDFKCKQVLQNAKWGQITALTWITAEPTTAQKEISICVGTGRGNVSLFPLANDNTWFRWKDSALLTPFEFNDAVEVQTFDPINCRLALASHSGQIKMFDVDGSCKLTATWKASINDAIPSGLIFFGGANQNLLIHGTETGQMVCRNAQNSTVLWTKTLAGGIGNAVLSPDETKLLVDNLTTGTFDIYCFPSNTPSRSFPLTSTRRFAKQCVFGEEGNIAVCGSDCGRVYVIDVATGDLIQSLICGKEEDLVQTVASTTSGSNRILVASGLSNIRSSEIYIWEKQLLETPVPAENTNLGTPETNTGSNSTRQSALNTFFAVVIMLVSYPTWSPFFWNLIVKTSVVLAHLADFLAKFSQTDLNGYTMDGFEPVDTL